MTIVKLFLSILQRGESLELQYRTAEHMIQTGEQLQRRQKSRSVMEYYKALLLSLQAN